MTDFVIPCETVVRLAQIPVADGGEWFHSIRIENDTAIATNQKVMAVERIAGGPGVVHIKLDDALLKQCATEAPFKSNLMITVVDMLKYATAKTTLGYTHPSNCAVWSDTRSKFDNWRQIVDRAVVAPLVSEGGMFWQVDEITRLGKASPSGHVIFPQFIDVNQPIIVCDPTDPEWFGVFMGYAQEADYPAATLPKWYTK